MKKKPPRELKKPNNVLWFVSLTKISFCSSCINLGLCRNQKLPKSVKRKSVIDLKLRLNKSKPKRKLDKLLLKPRQRKSKRRRPLLYV